MQIKQRTPKLMEQINGYTAFLLVPTRKFI